MTQRLKTKSAAVVPPLALFSHANSHEEGESMIQGLTTRRKKHPEADLENLAQYEIRLKDDKEGESDQWSDEDFYLVQAIARTKERLSRRYNRLRHGTCIFVGLVAVFIVVLAVKSSSSSRVEYGQPSYPTASVPSPSPDYSEDHPINNEHPNNLPAASVPSPASSPQHDNSLASGVVPTHIVDVNDERVTFPIRFENSEVTVQVPHYSLKSLANPESPQAKSLHWISKSYADADLQNMAEWRKQQLFAMASIYYSVGGDQWHDQSRVGWMDPSTPECQWSQNAQDCSGTGRTTDLYMAGIHGGFPPEIGLLPALQSLEFYYKADEHHHTAVYVSDMLPPQMPHDLQSLTFRVHSGYKRWTGRFPTYLWGLTQLTHLDIRGNALSGTISARVADLTNLKLLDMSDQAGQLLQGTIPSQIGLLTRLSFLGLGSNQLSGSLPTQLGLLERLTNATVSSNNLNGEIPMALFQLSYLQELRLNKNSFASTISPGLGLLSHLRILDLSDNELTGSIPTFLGLLHSAEYIHMGNNKLTGPIPSEIGNLNYTKAFHLASCSLTGTIPTEIGRLAALYRDLDLSHNQLTGAIPSQIGLLTSLKKNLDLTNNRLSGPIPSEIGHLAGKFFGPLMLSQNQLTGPIPSQLGLLMLTKQIELQKNQLNGNFVCALPAQHEISVDCPSVSCSTDCPCKCMR